MGLFDSIKKLFSSSGKKDSHNKRLSERIEHKKRVEQRYSGQEIIKDPYEKDQNSKTEQVETKSIRYKISDFREEFRSNITAVPENFMLIFFDAVAKGEEFIDVPVSVLKIAQENIKKNQKWDNTYNSIMSNSTTGQKAEKDGDTDKAIEFYKEAINIGEKSGIEIFHAYAYPYKRLFVLLHKQKRISEEINYLRTYLTHDLTERDRSKYTERLNKLDNNYKQATEKIQSEENSDCEKQCYEIFSNIRIAADMHKMENFSEAIEHYKKAIKIGENCKVDMFNSYSAAYKCLITLLNQQHKYEEEKLYIEAYLTHDLSEKETSIYKNMLNRLYKK